jgi:hypothetical protein
MVKVRGTVHDGRLRVDAAVDLPEDTEVELIAVPVDRGDDLDDVERRQLAEAIEEACAGDPSEDIPAEQVLAEVRAICGA